MAEPNTVLGLAAIRKNRGITLEHISNVTKISVRTLEAIEQGEFTKLPGGIYDTNYIRQYARAIDYDESAILAVYRRERPEPVAPQANRGFFSSFRAAISITS